MANLAEIIEEGKRQLGNYQTMILPHGDARTLLAVAKAAVGWEKADAVATHATYHDPECGRGPCEACAADELHVAAADALRAAVRGEGKETT